MSWLSKQIKSVGKIVKKNPVLSGAALAGSMFIPGVGPAVMGGLRAAGGAIGGLGGGAVGRGLSAVGSFAKNNPDAILGGLSAYQGMQAGRKADGMMDRALNDPGLNPERPDLSSTFAGYDSPYMGQPNPFGAEARQPMGMMDRSMPLRRVGRRVA